MSIQEPQQTRPQPVPDFIRADSDYDYDSSADSTFGDSDSFTTSINSSILEHVHENGRRYHSYKQGHYLFPNDETQTEGFDIMHHMFTMITDGKPFLAPIGDDPQMILDLGTGSGIWAIDVADLYPSATVIGTDLSPDQPTWVPPNLHFQIDDFTEPWTFEPNSFDFIHSRQLFGSVKDWTEHYKQCFTALKPGGYLEALERGIRSTSDDGSLPEDCPFRIFQEDAIRVSAKVGKSLNMSALIEGHIREAGFEVEQVIRTKLPMGDWPADPKLKKIGALMRYISLQNLEGYALALLTRLMGLSREQALVNIALYRRDMSNPRYHSYSDMVRVIARKPLSPSQSISPTPAPETRLEASPNGQTHEL